MLNPQLIPVLKAAGIDPRKDPPNPAELARLEAFWRLSREDPPSLLVELVRTRKRAGEAERSCAKAAEAASNLEKMLKDLLDAPSFLYRLEAIRHGPDGPRAICRGGGPIRDLPVHPDVDVERLERLQPWDYVRVCDNVVVGAWAEDSFLFAAAQGQVVTFQGYRDRESGLVQVSENAHGETVVRLAANLRDEEISNGSKLVLQRDDPGRAIAVVPAQQAHSRFEVPIEQIDTRLEDLAGMEPIARRLIEEVVVHVLNPLVCEAFGLELMKGFLLISYKPGMGKTAFTRAFAYWLHELGLQRGCLLYTSDAADDN